MTTNERLAALEVEVKLLTQAFYDFKRDMSAVISQLRICIDKYQETETGAMHDLNGRIRSVEVSSGGLKVGSNLLYKVLLGIVALGNIFMIVRSFIR